MVKVVEKPINQTSFDEAFGALAPISEKKSFLRAGEIIDRWLLKSYSISDLLSGIKPLEAFEETKRSTIATMALLLLHQKMHQLAENLLLKQIKIHGKDDLYSFLLAQNDMDLGMFDRGFHRFLNLYEEYRNPRCLLFDMAQAKIFLDEPEEALEFLIKAAESDYYSAFAQIATANLYMALGQKDKAQLPLKDRPGFFKKLQLNWQLCQEQALPSTPKK
jgi:predicted Zn-dependent protease